jgi:hypothetical protein
MTRIYWLDVHQATISAAVLDCTGKVGQLRFLGVYARFLLWTRIPVPAPGPRRLGVIVYALASREHCAPCSTIIPICFEEPRREFASEGP